MQQIVGSIPKRRILTLRPTYSRIALSDLAKKVGLGDAAGAATVKDVIGRMVASGEIRASVSGSPEIVTFEDDDDYDSPAAMQRLRDAQTVASSLLAELTHADQQLGLHPKWLQKVSVSQIGPSAFWAVADGVAAGALDRGQGEAEGAGGQDGAWGGRGRAARGRRGRRQPGRHWVLGGKTCRIEAFRVHI